MKPRTLAVSAVAALSIAAAACSRPGADERAFEWSTPLPSGAVLHLRNGSGAITVRRADGPNAVVTGGRQWRHGRASDVHFVVNQIGNEYYICAMWRNSGRCAANGYRGKSMGGFLTMFSLFHRSTDATAEITAEVPPNVQVDARTSNGSVSIDGTSGSVVAHTANGNLSVTNVAGPLALSTTNGNVNLSTDSVADDDSIHVTTTNGVIRAEVPASLQGSFDLSVVNGVVKSDLPIATTNAGRHLQGQIGSSSRVVKMHAVNGTVSVMARPTPASH